MGLTGIDLMDAPDWPTLRNHGLTPTMTSCAGSLPDGWNRKENHDKLEKQRRESIARAAARKSPASLPFPATAAGCLTPRAATTATSACADKLGITVCVEQLNSKVDHKHYKGDHTAWGVEVCKSVESLGVKPLYDICRTQLCRAT